jgi:hypothetical protein
MERVKRKDVLIVKGLGMTTRKHTLIEEPCAGQIAVSHTNWRKSWTAVLALISYRPIFIWKHSVKYNG